MRTSFLTLSIMLVAPVWYVYTQLRVPVVLLTYSLITLTTVLLYRNRLRSSSAVRRQGPGVVWRARAGAGCPAHDPAPHRTPDAPESARRTQSPSQTRRSSLSTASGVLHGDVAYRDGIPR